MAECLQKEVCLQLPVTPPKHTSPIKHVMVVIDRDDKGTVQPEIETVHLPHHVVITGSGQVDGSEGGDQEDGVDENDAMIQEIIREMNHLRGEDRVSIPAHKGCHTAKEFFIKHSLRWVPDCDCEGHYKPIQCLEIDKETQCWCSTQSGSEIQNSRKTINCTDPHSM